MSREPWIGVDLDGTLAEYGHWNNGIIGKPIKKMLDRINAWLAEGKKVKIMTARVAPPNNYAYVVSDIQDYLEEIGLPRLEVTCQKDMSMIELWDDRAIQVIRNTGERVGNIEID